MSDWRERTAGCWSWGPNEAKKGSFGQKAEPLQHHGQGLCPPSPPETAPATLPTLPVSYLGLGSPLELVEENIGIDLGTFNPPTGKQIGRIIALKILLLGQPGVW